MSKTVSTVLAIILVSVFPALSLLAGSGAPRFTEEHAVQVATQYLDGMPTYAFDGMPDTVEVVKVEPLRMPNTWEVTIEFTSRNGGYGDRTGVFVITVLTPHTTRIVVSEGRVIRAVTDEVYDEVNEVEFPTEDTTAEEAEEIAIVFLRNSPTFSFDGVPGSIRVLDVAVAESYPVQYFISVVFECSHAGYGDRTGQVLAQVITPHTIKIVVSSGEVRSAVIDGKWDELNQMDSAVSEFFTPEEARDHALAYVKAKYPEAGDLPASEEWSVTDLTPEGLLGASTFEYSGLGWTVRVGYPVVLKPTYTVVVNYSGEPSISWEGSVDLSGAVTELAQ
ncbi:hypothetical protein JXL21_10295 [Candidatus Bathyarchaeota archaeon]|nr:hypothetical protein [Candidatus Bathyarchaeota archaeon]